MTKRTLPLLVVVTGAPGSGKTTLARALASELALPLLAKDDVKEALFDELGGGDREWSRKLGRATYDVLFAVARRLLESGASCILESNFSDAAPLRALPPARGVQIFCSAPDDVVLERYANRKRHPGHLDAEIVEELRTRLASAEWRPLQLHGRLIEVETTTRVDAKSLARAVRG
jgi:predicted kinase